MLSGVSVSSILNVYLLKEGGGRVSKASAAVATCGLCSCAEDAGEDVFFYFTILLISPWVFVTLLFAPIFAPTMYNLN